MEVGVDIGSGRGWVLRHLTNHSLARVTGVDMSETMINTAPIPEDVITEKLVMDVFTPCSHDASEQL